MALSTGLKNSLLRGVTSPTVSSTARSVENARQRLESVGMEAPRSKPNFLVSLLETLSRPGYAGANLLQEITSPYEGATPNKFDPLSAFWRGLTLQEKTTGKDIMTDLGLPSETGIFG